MVTSPHAARSSPFNGLTSVVGAVSSAGPAAAPGCSWLSERRERDWVELEILWDGIPFLPEGSVSWCSDGLAWVVPCPGPVPIRRTRFPPRCSAILAAHPAIKDAALAPHCPSTAPPFRPRPAARHTSPSELAF